MAKTSTKEAIEIIENWFEEKGWSSHSFQKQTWKAYNQGYSGILNAPTGSGKTYALGLAILIEQFRLQDNKKGLKAIWITPIRALSIEIQLSLQRACDALGTGWTVEIRTGDTKASVKQRQKKKMPDILITTPESLHVLFSNKESAKLFKTLRTLVADEWHDLLGTKRAVLLELALSRLKAIQPKMKVWGISATIGNLDEALEVLLGSHSIEKSKIIKSSIKKKIAIQSVLPSESETLPWSGHYGTGLVKSVLPIINNSKTTLLFTNTRAQSEIWYQNVLAAQPSLAGQMAMHHGSIGKELRNWVESELHEERLKLVVCTSSLDLGVDFRPVETIIQVGSPKGIARFMQRAGRSNHRPGEISKIHFVPTHALELVEAAALRDAVKQGEVEIRIPYLRSFDVLMQYCMTLAVSDGFYAKDLLEQVRSTFSYKSLSENEFVEIVNFLVYGGETLSSYDEYHKLKKAENGRYFVDSRRIAMRHRMSIGTIVSDLVFKIKYQSGGYIGTIEEWFITRLKPGDVFWFAGRNLELLQIRGNEVKVKNSKKKAGQVPSWMGGRMPLSSQMSHILRKKLTEAQLNKTKEPELIALKELLDTQRERSAIPAETEFLIEKVESKEGFHVYFYPFEGRFVHEGLGAIFAYRISQLLPISFTIAYNDYGFELLSDQPIPVEEAIEKGLFSDDDLYNTIQKSINASEMAQLKFRDIAVISGMVFTGLPGKEVKERHLQASSSLIFKVLNEHAPNNLLVKQAYEEVFQFQLEEGRMRQAIQRIQKQKVVITSPEKYTPFCFPILVDRLRQKVSSEKLSDKIKKMQLQHR